MKRRIDDIVAPRHHGLSRRGFVIGGLIAGSTLATTPAKAQAVHTDAQGLQAGDAKVTVSGGGLPAYFARPDGGGRFPVVLVIEEIFGLHDYIKDICRRLAHRGYLAVAPNLYARITDLSKMSDADAIMRDVIPKAPDATMFSDLDATMAWAAANHGDTARLAVTGFGQGGRDTWLYATHNPRLKAAVAWYGPVAGPTGTLQPRNPIGVANTLRCPLLGLYGGQDPRINLSDVQVAAERAKAAGKLVDIVVYPDAGYGFHADYRTNYQAADAIDGWRRMLAWFHKYGV